MLILTTIIIFSIAMAIFVGFLTSVVMTIATKIVGRRYNVNATININAILSNANQKIKRYFSSKPTKKKTVYKEYILIDCVEKKSH